MIKKKTVNVRSPFIRYFLESKAGVIISNWVFQGTLYMENAERLYKVLFECIFFVAYFFLLSLTGVAIYKRVFFAFCLSHTTNWIFNGHLFVLGRYLGFTRSEARAFIEYPRNIKARLLRKKSIDAVAFFGSLSRGNFSSSSDLDIRIIPRQGIANGLIASFWAFVERTRALFHRYPLDLYVIRTSDSLQKINRDEYPIVLFDRVGFFSKHYTNFFNYEDFLVRFIKKYVEKK